MTFWNRLTRLFFRKPVSWSEALDRVATAFQDKAAKLGTETVWPYYYAGTMGLVHRDGINRFRHELKYSRQINTICTRTCESGWMAGVGRIAMITPPGQLSPAVLAAELATCTGDAARISRTAVQAGQLRSLLGEAAKRTAPVWLADYLR